MARRNTPVYASTRIGIALAAVGFTVKISFSVFLREIFFYKINKDHAHFASFCPEAGNDGVPLRWNERSQTFLEEI